MGVSTLQEEAEDADYGGMASILWPDFPGKGGFSLNPRSFYSGKSFWRSGSPSPAPLLSLYCVCLDGEMNHDRNV